MKHSINDIFTIYSKLLSLILLVVLNKLFLLSLVQETTSEII